MSAYESVKGQQMFTGMPEKLNRHHEVPRIWLLVNPIYRIGVRRIVWVVVIVSTSGIPAQISMRT